FFLSFAREREEQSSDNSEPGLNRALTVDSSPPIDPDALLLLRRERCHDRVCVGCWSCLSQQLACLASLLVCSRNHVLGSLRSWPLFLSLTMAGELATELTTRTMDMLRTTNLGILVKEWSIGSFLVPRSGGRLVVFCLVVL
ncbi:unnamed protein product, partial [Brassica rapa subsp. trilocularis]